MTILKSITSFGSSNAIAKTSKSVYSDASNQSINFGQNSAADWNDGGDNSGGSSGGGRGPIIIIINNRRRQQ